MTRFIPARLRTTVTGILTIVQGLPVPAATSGQSVAPAQMSPAEVAQIVEEAYIYGFPMSEYLDLLLQFCPPVGTAEVEKPLRAKFASIGIGPGKTIPHKDLSPEQKAPVAEALKRAFETIETTANSIGQSINGWQVGSAQGNRRAQAAGCSARWRQVAGEHHSDRRALRPRWAVPGPTGQGLLGSPRTPETDPEP